MNVETVGILGIVATVILLFAGMWIGLAMAVVGFVGIWYIVSLETAFETVVSIPFFKVGSYGLSVIPLFLLMGAIVGNSGIGAELYKGAYKWVGQFRGGLAMATVVASAFFAAVSGSTMAAIAVFGKVALPEMRNVGYDERLATGSIASSATLAFLIPPSLAFIIYGIITETSIGALFMAGILPGLLVAVAYMITIGIITASRPQAGPAGPRTRFREKISGLKQVWHVVVLFLIVIGGIYRGVFTPTEAGAVGAFGAFAITAATRKLTTRIFLDSLKDTARGTGMIFILIVGAHIFMRFLAVSELPFALSDFVAQLGWPPIAVLAMIVLIYVIIGMFMDIVAAVMLTVPILLPTLLEYGFHPIWFGVIVVMLINMGIITPPVATSAYLLSGITGVPPPTVFRGIVPFLIASIICIFILAIFPEIALFLPLRM